MPKSLSNPARLINLFLTLGLAMGAPGPAGGAAVLVIYGNSNETVAEGSLSLGDAWVKQRLETSLRHQTRFMWDQTPKDRMLAAADSADLVMVLESVTSAYLTDKLKSTPVPVLNCEAMIQDDLGLTAAGTPGDPGPPSRFEYGVIDNATDILIRDPAHPLAGGLQGLVHVYGSKKEINWGKVAATARIVATLASDETGAALYLYEKGSRLFDGTSAAGLRIGFFLEDDNLTGTGPFLTAEGLKLFDGAVAYALGSTTALYGRVTPTPPGPGSARTDALGRNAPEKDGNPTWSKPGRHW